MISAQNFSGFVAFVVILAVPLTALLSVVVRARYRRAVTRAMMAGSEADRAEFEVPSAAFPNRARLDFDVADLPRRTRLRTGLALRYMLAGSACSVVLVLLIFLLNGIALLPVRFAVTVAAFAFTGLVMALHVAGVRWYLILLVSAAWIAGLHVVAPESSSLIAILSLPSLLLALLLANPLLRTTTLPLFLVAVSVVVPLTLSLDVIYLAMSAGVLDELVGSLSPVVGTAIYVMCGLGVMLAVGVALGLLAVRLVARATAGSSEFVMQHDVVWMFQTIWLVGLGWGSNGAVVLVHVLGFVAYRLVLRLLRPAGAAAAINLHLRVFGQRTSQTRLARGLLMEWRQDGPVLLIGAADLATETLDAPELAAFLMRRLDRVFIGTPADLARALHSGDGRLDDGLFPLRDYYCRDDSWRPTVLTLMSRAQRVLVDLRGLDPENLGIRYEIDALAARVPADQITVVVDRDDLETAKALFAQAWAASGRPGGQDRLAIRVA